MALPKLYSISGSAASRKTSKAIGHAVKRAIKGKTVVFINTEETLDWIYESFAEQITKAGYPDDQDSLSIFVNAIDLTSDTVYNAVTLAMQTFDNVDLLVVDANVYTDQELELLSKISVDRKIEVVYTKSIIAERANKVGRKPLAKLIKM